ncbi:MAG: hypothetical protein LBE89_07300 [Helicobacteraceae bacterium]|jgi:hypothetical protein|nr:hypothetical protein [Helicobacteraceae bacterium]
MTAEQFIKQLNALPPEARGGFSATALTLSKLAAAEAVAHLIKDDDFAVRISGVKAIRKFELDIYEKDIIRLLLDRSNEVKAASFKSLASFGKPEHFKMAKAFYEENKQLRSIVIDSFVNYSDIFEAHLFMFNQLDNANQKIRESANNWFEKAFDKEIFLPWIEDIYDRAPWSLRLIFEESFAHRLKQMFSSWKHGYRFKLLYLIKRGAV